MSPLALETAQWCSLRLDAEAGDWASVLRTKALQSGDLMMAGARIQGQSEADVEIARRRIVEDVATRRRDLLRLERSLRTVPHAISGRILQIDLEGSFFDGVAKELTHGFFDEADLPPWDTWIRYHPVPSGPSRLQSWIPVALVESVERAVQAHMCNAFEWIETDEAR